MAHPAEIKQAVRADVVQGMSLTQACKNHDVPLATGRQWKNAAKRKGDDWFLARQARGMSAGSIESITSTVLEDFILLWKGTIEAMKNKEMCPVEKAETMARMSDSLVKTMKAVSPHMPTLNKLAVAMDVIKDLASYVRKHKPEMYGDLIDVFEPFGEELSKKYGK